jgi:hypothetical protein
MKPLLPRLFALPRERRRRRKGDFSMGEVKWMLPHPHRHPAERVAREPEPRLRGGGR